MHTSKELQLTLEAHNAFYQVSPHYVVVDHRQGTSERVQNGFDVLVYGVKTDHDDSFLPPPRTYAQAYQGIRQIAEQVARETSHCSVVDATPLPATVVLNPRDGAKVTGVVVVRIVRRDVNEPAGPEEARALEALERAFKAIGLARR